MAVPLLDGVCVYLHKHIQKGWQSQQQTVELYTSQERERMLGVREPHRENLLRMFLIVSFNSLPLFEDLRKDI